jgi:hypothetical protein
LQLAELAAGSLAVCGPEEQQLRVTCLEILSSSRLSCACSVVHYRMHLREL